MKKNNCLAIVAVLLVAVMLLAGCSGGATGSGGSDAVAEPLKGTSEDVLAQVTDAAAETLDEATQMPKTLTDPVTADNAGNMIGLIPDDFDQYVDNATSATGAIMTMAFEIAVVKCKDASAAAEVSAKIAAGFDSGKWICVAPEQSLVTSAGSYVLLAVGGKTQTDALAAAFADAAGGNASAPNVFYQKGDAPAGGGLSFDLPVGNGEGDEAEGGLKPL